MSASSTFTARYHSPCADCPRPIKPGDEVTFLSQGGVIHVDCEDTSHVPTNARQHPVCGICWLEHPAGGECP